MATKVYHVSKRETGEWAITLADGKTIKLCATKAEAEEYANKVGKNQEGTVLVHNSKGKKAGKIASSSKYAAKK